MVTNHNNQIRLLFSQVFKTTYLPTTIILLGH